MLGRMLAGLLRRRGTAAERSYGQATSSRERGDWVQAIDLYRRTLMAQPDHAQAHNDLGTALCATGDYAGARAAFAQALALREHLVPAHVNMGQLLFSEFRDYRQAASHYRVALASDPGQNQARTGLALALYECGLVEEAVECLREAVQRSPDDATAHQFMLFMSNALAHRDPEPWHDLHRLWGQRHADGLPRYAHPPRQAGVRLRVGYVSADFREHATANFVATMLAGHDPKVCEIVCYGNSSETDSVTVEMQRYAHLWRRIDALDDAQAARLIRDDAIDILVDLSGHTRGNRLGVFARKPAPVQIAYLGYLNTTGMAAMDYRITDANADPPGAERFHSETLLRMPQSSWCCRPPGDAPPVATLPAQRSGYVTFGSFNHIAKLNADVLETWAELLCRLPGSRLQVMAVPDEEAGARICASLQAHGVDSSQIRTSPRLPRGQYWQQHADIDIALDPFPYTGGATTFESLWMGLPVVTLAGNFGFARSAATVLVNAGLPECIAADRRQYLEIACRLAGDLTLLADMRRGMRERVRASPILDAPRFGAALEHLYRGAWREWCAQRGRHA